MHNRFIPIATSTKSFLLKLVDLFMNEVMQRKTPGLTKSAIKIYLKLKLTFILSFFAYFVTRIDIEEVKL